MTSEARPGSPLWLGGEAAQHHSQMSEAQFVGGTGTVDRDHPYIVSRDRKHGDPFPLPRLDKDFAFAEDFNFDLRGLSSLHLQLVNEAIRSANGLAGVCMRAKHSALSFPAASRKRPTSVQVTMINDLVARILEVGPPPEGLREDDALKELAGASYLYEEANNLAKYDPEKIKIFKRRLHPLEARSLCSKDVEPSAAWTSLSITSWNKALEKSLVYMMASLSVNGDSSDLLLDKAPCGKILAALHGHPSTPPKRCQERWRFVEAHVEAMEVQAGAHQPERGLQRRAYFWPCWSEAFLGNNIKL